MYKLNCCVAVAGASVPLILAGAASGEVLGLKAVKKFVDPADIAADTNIPGITSLLVVNVYATFTPGDAAANVIAAGGSVALGILLEVNVVDGTFFQHPFGNAAHLSPSAALASVPGFNALKYDSFVTIGRKLDNDPVFGPDQTQVQTLETWTDTQFTGGPEADWFVAGFPPQGDPGSAPDNPPDEVLIAQFTVANPGPNGGVFGQMFLFGFHTNAAGVVETYTITGVFDNQGAAPGACCFNDGTCQDLSASACAAAGGTAQGSGTFCLGDNDGDGVDDACPSAEPCPGDLDGDGQVSVPDLLLLLADFGSCDGSPADFDGDGCVGVPDLLALIANFGPCPGSECVWDVNGDGFVDNDDLQQVLANQGPCDGCAEDVNGDGIVNGLDAAAVAAHFGPCP